MPQIDAKNQLECWHAPYKLVKLLGSLFLPRHGLCRFYAELAVIPYFGATSGTTARTGRPCCAIAALKAAMRSRMAGCEAK